MGARTFWRKGRAQDLSEVDAVIFDVDGVLVYVEESFPFVVIEVVREWLKSGGAKIDTSPLTVGDFLAFKRAGGFNSDWDLSLAATLFFLAKRGIYGEDLSAWREKPPLLVEFLEAVKERGGGLEAAVEVTKEFLGKRDFEKLREKWDKEGIIRLFMETYAGRFCQRIYGFKGGREDEGYISKERLLVDISLLQELDIPKGVVTGRTRGETEVCFELLGLEGLFPAWAVLTHDDGVSKPDPWGLLEVSRRLDSRKPVYVGDTVDDFEMVMRARKDELYAICALVLSGHGGKGNVDFYWEIGAEWVAGDVNEVLRAISDAKRRARKVGKGGESEPENEGNRCQD